jgi:hypothetical protein
MYSVAVAARAHQLESAARLAALLAGESTRELRRNCGFET